MSSTDRLIVLLDREADGTLTEGETAELAGSLAADPQMRRTREEHLRFAELLRQVDEVEPPPDLGRQLLAAVPVPKRSRPGLLASLRDVLTGKRVLVYAGAAAAVVIVAFFGRDFIGPVNEVGKTDGLTGSMAPRTEPTSPKLTEMTLHSADLDGSIRLASSEDGVAVLVDVASDTALELVLTFDERLLSLVGASPEAGLSIDSQPGQVTLRGLGASARSARISLAAASENVETTIQFELFGSGSRLQEGTLTWRAR